MRLRLISERKDKDFFDYKDITSDMWRKLVHAERDKAKINFDMENDEDVAQREIVVGDKKFRCELRCAGGDWETPVLYFRVQLVDGYVGDLLKSNGCFIFIPGKEEGNPHLVKTKKGWTAPTDEDDSDEERNERQAWVAVKKHLNTLD